MVIAGFLNSDPHRTQKKNEPEKIVWIFCACVSAFGCLLRFVNQMSHLRHMIFGGVECEHSLPWRLNAILDESERALELRVRMRHFDDFVIPEYVSCCYGPAELALVTVRVCFCALQNENYQCKGARFAYSSNTANMCDCDLRPVFVLTRSNVINIDRHAIACETLFVHLVTYSGFCLCQVVWKRYVCKKAAYNV